MCLPFSLANIKNDDVKIHDNKHLRTGLNNGQTELITINILSIFQFIDKQIFIA